MTATTQESSSMTKPRQRLRSIQTPPSCTATDASRAHPTWNIWSKLLRRPRSSSIHQIWDSSNKKPSCPARPQVKASCSRIWVKTMRTDSISIINRRQFASIASWSLRSSRWRSGAVWVPAAILIKPSLMEPSKGNVVRRCRMLSQGRSTLLHLIATWIAVKVARF